MHLLCLLVLFIMRGLVLCSSILVIGWASPVPQVLPGIPAGVGIPLPQSSSSQGVGIPLPQSSSRQGVGIPIPQSSSSQGFGIPIPQSSSSQGFGIPIPQSSSSQGVGIPLPQSSSSQGFTSPVPVPQVLPGISGSQGVGIPLPSSATPQIPGAQGTFSAGFPSQDPFTPSQPIQDFSSPSQIPGSLNPFSLGQDQQQDFSPLSLFEDQQSLFEDQQSLFEDQQEVFSPISPFELTSQGSFLQDPINQNTGSPQDTFSQNSFPQIIADDPSSQNSITQSDDTRIFSQLNPIPVTQNTFSQGSGIPLPGTGNTVGTFSSQVSQDAPSGPSFNLNAPCSAGLIRNTDGRCAKPIVSRNIYVYGAPIQPQAPVQRLRVPPPKLEYNIVFVSSPEAPESPEPILIPPPQQKTLVYLLSKKADSSGQRVIEAPASPPSEPEVYFVNYGPGENTLLPGGVDLQSALGNPTTFGQANSVLAGGAASGAGNPTAGIGSGTAAIGIPIPGGSSGSGFGSGPGNSGVPSSQGTSGFGLGQFNNAAQGGFSGAGGFGGASGVGGGSGIPLPGFSAKSGQAQNDIRSNAINSDSSIFS